MISKSDSIVLEFTFNESGILPKALKEKFDRYLKPN